MILNVMISLSTLQAASDIVFHSHIQILILRHYFLGRKS